MTSHDFHDPQDERTAAAGAHAAPDDAFLAMLHLRGEPIGDDLVHHDDQARALNARLGADPALRAEAQSLAELDAMLRGVAARTAGSGITPSMSDRALQSSLRLVREQALLRRQAAANRRRRIIRDVPRWAWGTAAAAAIAVGFVFWTVNTEPGTKLTQLVEPSDADPMPEWTLSPSFGSIEIATVNEPDGTEEQIQEQINALDFIAQMSDEN